MAAELRKIDCEPPGVTIGDRLDDLREAYEQGRLSAIAFAVVYRDGSTGDGWSDTPSRATMIGAVDVLKHRLIETHMDANQC